MNESRYDLGGGLMAHAKTCDGAIPGPTLRLNVSDTAPNGWHPHALAPRGWYMVFLVDHGGVPSEGRFMHLH